MSETYISLIMDNGKNFDTKDNLIKDFFEIDSNESCDNYFMGINQKGNFILDFEQNAVDLIFINDVPDNVVYFWENKLIDFAKMYFSDEKILFKKSSDIYGNQFRLLNS